MNLNFWHLLVSINWNRFTTTWKSWARKFWNSRGLLNTQIFLFVFFDRLFIWFSETNKFLMSFAYIIWRSFGVIHKLGIQRCLLRFLNIVLDYCRTLLLYYTRRLHYHLIFRLRCNWALMFSRQNLYVLRKNQFWFEIKGCLSLEHWETVLNNFRR